MNGIFSFCPSLLYIESHLMWPRLASTQYVAKDDLKDLILLLLLTPNLMACTPNTCTPKNQTWIFGMLHRPFPTELQPSLLLHRPSPTGLQLSFLLHRPSPSELQPSFLLVSIIFSLFLNTELSSHVCQVLAEQSLGKGPPRSWWDALRPG